MVFFEKAVQIFQDTLPQNKKFVPEMIDGLTRKSRFFQSNIIGNEDAPKMMSLQDYERKRL